MFDFCKGSVLALVLSVLSACAHQSSVQVSVVDNSLMAKEWRVDRFAQRSVLANAPITMTFGTDGRVSGSTTCNMYNSSYEVGAGSLHIGQGMMTQRACLEEAYSQQESQFMGLLNQVNRYSINQGVLVLKTADGQSITAH